MADLIGHLKSGMTGRLATKDTMTDILEGLNSRQKEAVTATEGRIRVVAGAGTGKTKALTHRYAYLVNVLGIDPANILCLTFTNKAAAEMRARIAGMVHSGDYNDFVCTIHGFCVKCAPSTASASSSSGRKSTALASRKGSRCWTRRTARPSRSRRWTRWASSVPRRRSSSSWMRFPLTRP